MKNRIGFWQEEIGLQEEALEMRTEIVRVGQGREAFTPQEEEALLRAGNIIKQGGLVAFPTETVYGLGGDAMNPESARKIYAAKGRPSDNPLIVHICRWADIGLVAERVPEAARRLGEAFWPGPLTMILPKAARVPKETTGGLDTVAVRLPSHPAARRLIALGGGFIAAPSANVSGRPSPTSAAHVEADLQGRIEMIVDGGPVGIGLESTILDLTVEPPQILRPGYGTEGMLQRVPVLHTGNGGTGGSPGSRHEVPALCPRRGASGGGRASPGGGGLYQPSDSPGQGGGRKNRCHGNAGTT